MPNRKKTELWKNKENEHFHLFAISFASKSDFMLYNVRHRIACCDWTRSETYERNEREIDDESIDNDKNIPKRKKNEIISLLSMLLLF